MISAKFFLFATLLISTAVKADDLATVMSSGACKNVPTTDLEEKYIIKDKGNLREMLEDPSSRTWNFANLQNDIQSLVLGESDSSIPTACLDELYVASREEADSYWQLREEQADCESSPDTDECKWVKQNLDYLDALDTQFETKFAARLSELEQEEQQTEAAGCEGDCGNSGENPLQDARAAACCEVFKEKDPGISPDQCLALHKGTAPAPGAKDCLIRGAKAAGHAFMANLTSVANLFSWSFWSGLASLGRELIQNPMAASEKLIMGLLKMFGIDPEYKTCLAENQRFIYQCEMVSTLVTQIGMIAKGWDLVMRAVGVGAKVAGLDKLGQALKATKASVAKGVQKGQKTLQRSSRAAIASVTTTFQRLKSYKIGQKMKAAREQMRQRAQTMAREFRSNRTTAQMQNQIAALQKTDISKLSRRQKRLVATQIRALRTAINRQGQINRAARRAPPRSTGTSVRNSPPARSGPSSTTTSSRGGGSSGSTTGSGGSMSGSASGSSAGSRVGRSTNSRARNSSASGTTRRSSNRAAKPQEPVQGELFPQGAAGPSGRNTTSGTPPKPKPEPEQQNLPFGEPEQLPLPFGNPASSGSSSVGGTSTSGRGAAVHRGSGQSATRNSDRKDRITGKGAAKGSATVLTLKSAGDASKDEQEKKQNEGPNGSVKGSETSSEVSPETSSEGFPEVPPEAPAEGGP